MGGAQGAQEIADALRENSTLTTLDLSGNNVKDEGAVSLADALEVNKTLSTLSLSSNYIGDVTFGRQRNQRRSRTGDRGSCTGSWCGVASRPLRTAEAEGMRLVLLPASCQEHAVACKK